MYVIEVIPLAKGVTLGTLTYYSSTQYSEGTLVPIPVRGKTYQGLVTSSQPVSLAKTALKTATFSLRKLPSIENPATLPENILATAKKLQSLYPAELGALLHALLPPQVTDGTYLFPTSRFNKGSADPMPQILTDTTEHRYLAYKTHIREAFAHRGSVLFVVPTTAHIACAQSRIEKGIEQRVITFSTAHTKKMLSASYKALEDLSMAKVCIVTPPFAFIERADFTTIILDECASPHYTERTRPYIDTKEALKVHASVSLRSLLLGDILPSTQEEYLRRSDIYTTHQGHATRHEFRSSLLIAEHPKKESGEKFAVCTQMLLDGLRRTFENTGHAFLYSARKGLATVITCFDCGHIFRCPDSGAPYSLLRTYKGDDEERWFVSSVSGKKVRADDVCPSCGGWRLSPQGIGVQQVYDAMQEHFPKIDIVLFDHTTATTHKKARELSEQFYGSKKGLLIGTHMALPYLHKPVDVTGVISYEAMRATPTWRVDEHTLSTLLTLREKTTKDLIVQIRTQKDEILSLAEKGLIDQFYEGEIEVRKALKYPPFAKFILCTFTGNPDHLKETQILIATRLGEHVQFYNAPQSASGETIRYGLLRHTGTQKEYEDILLVSRSLPPYIKIEINPSRII